jgi:hypothetical protein
VPSPLFLRLFSVWSEVLPYRKCDRRAVGSTQPDQAFIQLSLRHYSNLSVDGARWRNIIFAPIMKRLLAAAIAVALPCFTLPAVAQEPEWIRTEVYVAAIEQEFRHCMDSAIAAGAPVTNGLLLACTPSGADMDNVLAGVQPITSMIACVDWSLAAMAGIITAETMSELNANTQCETEGIELWSVNQMWQSVRESEIEPYGI